MANQSYQSLVEGLCTRVQGWLSSRSGAALLQVWACRDLEEGVVLSTRDLPYFMLGDGDELCLFRYMSTKVTFPVNGETATGAEVVSPGGCFTSRQATCVVDISQMDSEICPRADVARLCHVHSALIVPLLDPVLCQKTDPLAVLEVMLSQAHDVSALKELHVLLVSAVVDAGYALPVETGESVSTDLAPAPSPEPRAGAADGCLPELRALIDLGAASGDSPSELNVPAQRGSAALRTSTELEDEDTDSGAEDNAGVRGTQGRLTLVDLQSQFGNGVKDAAKNLGVCVTTLKRACRRHGIKRWPRRQLVKLQRALAEVGTMGTGISSTVSAAAVVAGRQLGTQPSGQAQATTTTSAGPPQHPTVGFRPIPSSKTASLSSLSGYEAPQQSDAVSGATSVRPRRAAAAAAQSRLAAVAMAIEDTAATPPRQSTRRANISGRRNVLPKPSSREEEEPVRLHEPQPTRPLAFFCVDEKPTQTQTPPRPQNIFQMLGMSPGLQQVHNHQARHSHEEVDADLWAAAASALGVTPPRVSPGTKRSLYAQVAAGAGGWGHGPVDQGLEGLGLELLGPTSPLRVL